MHLDISYNADLEEINIIFEDSVNLRSYKNSAGKIVYGAGFDSITDDEEFNCLKKICDSIFALA